MLVMSAHYIILMSENDLSTPKYQEQSQSTQP